MKIDIFTEMTSPANPSSLDISSIAIASGGPRGGPRAPFFVPRDQAYYWTHEWQRAEAEGLREIAEGNVRRFASGSAAAAWLLSDAEDS